MKTLYTQRLILRDFAQTDLVDFNRYCSVEGVGEMAGWSCHKSMEESQEILSRFIAEGHTYCLEDNLSHVVIGSIGIEEKNNEIFDIVRQKGLFGTIVEIGYVLEKQHWNKGLMTEAVFTAGRCRTMQKQFRAVLQRPVNESSVIRLQFTAAAEQTQVLVLTATSVTLTES